MVKVLEKLGCKVTYNANQTCCGQPAFNAGYWDDAKSVAKKFLHDFEGDGYIVGPSGSCTGFVRNYYDKMLENSAERLAASLASLPKADIASLMDDGKTLDIECDYCRKKYEFTMEQLRGLLEPN